MKKLLSILLTLAMLVSMAPAALATGAEITVSSATAAPGDTVTITVTLSGSPEVKSMMITPTYDPAVLELVSGEWTDAMDSALLSMGWTAEEPDAVAAFLKNAAITGSIFEMQFKVLTGAPVGSSAVSVDVAAKTVSGGKETDLSLTVKAGAVTVSCKHAKTETIPAVAAACDKAGSTEGKKCADCGEIITAVKEIPAKGHSFSDGKCSACGAADPNYVAPCKHTKTETIPAVAATCDKAGSTEGKKCADCGEIITAVKEIPAKGHSFSDGKCSACGAADPNYKEPTPDIFVNPFIDVAESDYFYQPVMWAVQKGVTGGTSPNTFSPNNPCTRGQVVTFLWAASGRPEPGSYSNPFSDVSSTDYYYKAVLWAVEEGITGGIGNGMFGPNNPCTRAQVATFLWVACNGSYYVYNESPFVDVSVDAYYFYPVVWALEEGITGGIGNNCFGSDNTCTRGQIATFLYKALG